MLSGASCEMNLTLRRDEGIGYMYKGQTVWNCLSWPHDHLCLGVVGAMNLQWNDHPREVTVALPPEV